MTLLERIELTVKYKPVSYGKCNDLFLQCKLSSKERHWMECLAVAGSPVTNRRYTSKEETRCLEKIHNFLLFPLLSRTALLGGTDQGLITIHHTKFSIFTASKNWKPEQSMRMAQFFPERQGSLWWTSPLSFLPAWSSDAWNLGSSQISKNPINNN